MLSDVRGKNVRSTDDLVDLEVDLVGQEILGEIVNGGGDLMSGMVDCRYDPDLGSEEKVRMSREHSDGTVTEIHVDRNRETGELSDAKFKDPPDNTKSRSNLEE